MFWGGSEVLGEELADEGDLGGELGRPIRRLWIVDRGSWIVDVKKMLRCLLAWLGWVGMRRRLDSDIPGAASG